MEYIQHSLQSMILWCVFFIYETGANQFLFSKLVPCFKICKFTVCSVGVDFLKCLLTYVIFHTYVGQMVFAYVRCCMHAHIPSLFPFIMHDG